MIYNNCELLDPIGSTNPKYYIVGYNATQEEISSQILFSPLASDGNRYLHSVLSSLSISNDTRFNKIMKFNDNRNSWNFTEEQIELGKSQLFEDIVNSNPNVIIALGSKVAELLLGNKFVSLSTQAGKNIKCRINGKDYPLVITYSSDYLVKNDSDEDEDESGDGYSEDSQNKQKFMKDLMYSCKIANGEISDLSAKELVVAKSFDKFEEYYREHIANSEYIAYDIETNARQVHSDSFRIIGFSLSPNPMSGIYVVKESLDYIIPDDDWERIVNLTKSILSDKKVIVHNCMYEVPSTLNCWSLRIKEFDDTLIMSRLLLGGKTGAGLKEQCSINLGYPEWEEDLTDYRNIIDFFRSIMKPTKGGKTRWYYDYLVEHDGSLQSMLENLVEYYNGELVKYQNELNGGLVTQEEYDEKVKKLSEDKGQIAINQINSLKVLIRDYYPEDSEFEDIMHKVGKELIYLIDSNNYGFLPYSSVPSRLLSIYGAIDAVGTRELFDVLSNRINNESTKEVDLWRGYRVMKSQFKVAISMEMNGIYWDDKVAEDEYNWFNAKAIESIKNLLMSGFLDDKIYDSCGEDWIKYLIEYNPEELRNEIGENYFLTAKGIKRESGGREVLFRNVPNLMSKEYWITNRDLILNYMKNIRIHDEERYKWFSDYTYLYNPGSPNQHILLNSILITDDIRIANVMYLFTLILDDNNSNWESSFSDNDKIPFEMIKSIREYNIDAAKYNETDEGRKNPKELISKAELFQKFKSVIENIRFDSAELNQKLIDGLGYKLENAREGSLLELYNLFEIVGYDIETDRSAWSKEFAFLIDYRSFKKCTKMMNTYITGPKIGRGSVGIVKREDIDNNKELPIRTGWYNGTKQEGTEYLLQPSFNVCGAETFRWKSGAHTIPGDATIKNIYRSRYKGGVIFAPDYSQAEIRAMAGASNCKSMINAFLNGADIHKFNASKIFRVSEDEVTSAQRRYAKMFSFSILYGSTPEGAAADYLNNDIALARSIFDDFYTAFPEVKDFIANMHDYMHKYHKVPVTQTGMFIKIDPSDFRGDVHKAERAAQNYPIQSASSNMAGYVLSQANEYLLERNMKSKTILFIHDSLEFDVHPYEMLELADYLIKNMNDIPLKTFGVPMKIDLAVGVSMGQEVEMKNLVLSEDKRSCECIIEGTQENFDLLVENWKQVYSVVEWEDVEPPKKEYIPKGNLFISKVAISRKLGCEQYEIKRKVKIAY